jgi:pyruvate,water dikinase
MREGIRSALRRTRLRTVAELDSSPVLTTVGGWAAADLELLGYVPPGKRALHLVDPRPGARRLAAAWRVGQVRAQLPGRVTSLLAGTDAALADVPATAQLDDDDLIRVMARGQELLAELHEAEVLSATLSGRAPASVPKIALDRLARGRTSLHPDHELIANEPVLLSLVPPRIGTDPELPRVDDEFLVLPSPVGDPGHRDLLRLRARWVQELLSRCADEAGARLQQRGQLADRQEVAWTNWHQLQSALAGDSTLPSELPHTEPGPPLPAHFRLDVHGHAVTVERPGPRGPGGVGAGGGRAVGVVVHEAARAGTGDVLVTRTLDPRLSVVLPRLTAIVSESGSTLSHLAILAREYQVPAVVAVHDALTRFPPGTRVVVDGTTGEVSVVPDPEEVLQ